MNLDRAARRAPALVAALLLSVSAAAAQTVETPRLRLEYLRAQRAYPFGEIPSGALQRARQDVLARFPGLARGDRAAAAAVADPPWTPLGPLRIDARDAGRLVTIAIDPRDANVLYVGGAQGGVWKTLDGGASWRPLTDGECSLAIGSIVLDPVNPDIVYAGTGELHFSADSYYGCGVLRSLDGGASWEQLGGAQFDTRDGGARIAQVLVDPQTAGSPFTTTVHVASSHGVFRSFDSGRTWARVLEGIATDLVRDPAAPGVLYAAIGHTGGHAANGMYRSADGGTTWQRLGGGFPGAGVGRIALTISRSAPGTLYAAIQEAFGVPGSRGGLLGIWRTDDGGATWRRLEARRAQCGTQCWYDLVIAVHPTDPERVYFGGISLYRSVDGGATFTDILGDIHVDQHAIVFHPHQPTTMYVGNDGGIYRTENGGTSWTPLNTNLAITQFYGGISLRPDDADRVLGGTQDNGTLEFSGDPDWTRVLGSDGGYTALDPTDANVAYAETQWVPSSGFSGPRRRDFPGPFELKVVGITFEDRALFIPPLVMDPVNPRVLYFGTFRLYRTEDRGELWSPLGGDLSRRGGAISAIAPAPSDTATLWVGTTDGNVLVTQDLGTTWIARTGGLPDRYVRDIDVATREPLDVVVVYSGFGTGHVFRTTDGGLTWADISGDLVDVPVNAVVRHPTLGDMIIAGTDLGTFATEDGGATWRPYGTGMPNVAVFDVAYNAVTGRVVAATHGRGAFALDPPGDLIVDLEPDSLGFAALGDTATLTLTVEGPAGVPAADAGAAWSSTDPAVAVVDVHGRVEARGNGTAGIVAVVRGAADTVTVEVEQVAVALAGLAGRERLVVDESVALDPVVVDANGHPIEGEGVALTTSDAEVLFIEPGPRVVALAEGSAWLVASAGTLRDSVRVAVQPPATLRLDVSDVAPASASARGGTRVPALRVSASVDGIEDVLLTRLRINVESPGLPGRLLLVHDVNGDDVPDAGEPVFAEAAFPALAGAVLLEPGALSVPADSARALLVVGEVGAGAANGSGFNAAFVPTGTTSLNTRSLRRDRIVQPGGSVASSHVRLSVLGDALLAFSENPVRSGRVIFSFAAPPRTAAVYTVAGRRVADLMRQRFPGDVEWDLTNDEGGRVAPGVYLVVFDIDGRVFREKLVVLAPGDDPERVPELSRRVPP